MRARFSAKRKISTMEYRSYFIKRILIVLNLMLVLGVAGFGAYNVFFVQVNEQSVIQKVMKLLFLTLLIFLPNILVLRFFKSNRGRKAAIATLAIWAIFCAIGLVSVKQTTFVLIICSLLIIVNTVSLIGVSTSKQRSGEINS